MLLINESLKADKARLEDERKNLISEIELIGEDQRAVEDKLGVVRRKMSNSSSEWMNLNDEEKSFWKDQSKWLQYFQSRYQELKDDGERLRIRLLTCFESEILLNQRIREIDMQLADTEKVSYGLEPKIEKGTMPGMAPDLQIVFRCAEMEMFRESDLNHNRIFIVQEDVALVEEFKKGLNAPRLLCFSSAKNRSVGPALFDFVLPFLNAEHPSMPRIQIAMEVQQRFIDPVVEMDSVMELMQYTYFSRFYPETKHFTPLSDMAFIVRSVSRSVDDSLVRSSSTAGYNRDIEYAYPLNIKTNRQEIFHVDVRMDLLFYRSKFYDSISTLSLAGGSQRLKVQESNGIDSVESVSSETDTQSWKNEPDSFFENEFVKLCVISVLNLVALGRVSAEGSTLAVPFVLNDREKYELYLVYKNKDEFQVRLLYSYDCNDMFQMAVLIFHLRNLPNCLPEIALIPDEEDIKNRVDLMKQKIGRCYTSISRENAELAAANMCLSSGELIDYYELQDYSHVTLPHPNIQRAHRKSDNRLVVLKLNMSRKEAAFLSLFNHAFLRTHPNNKSVEICDLFNSGNRYQAVMPPFQPLLDPLGHRLRIPDSDWNRLAQQLVDYVRFIHGLRICHRDIKPENLAVDSSGNLVVLDLGLMATYYGGDDMVYAFCGTEEYADPRYVENPSKGFSCYELEYYTVRKTIEWMVVW